MSKYTKVDQYIQRWKGADSKVKKYIIQLQVGYDTDDEEYEYFTKSIGDDYVCIQTVQMGLNTTPEEAESLGLIKKIRDIIAEDGMCALSWSCTGRTKHQVLSMQMKSYMPEYKFRIGYNYICEIFTNQISYESLI